MSAGMQGDVKGLASVLTQFFQANLEAMLPKQSAPQVFHMEQDQEDNVGNCGGEEEEECQYSGDQQQLDAWNGALAASSAAAEAATAPEDGNPDEAAAGGLQPPAAGQPDPSLTTMEADTDRPAATKRDLETDEAAEKFLPFDELGLDPVQDADEALLGTSSAMPAVKKAKGQKEPADKPTASEVATKLVLDMAAKFPTGPQQEASSADLAAAAHAGSSSG